MALGGRGTFLLFFILFCLTGRRKGVREGEEREEVGARGRELVMFGGLVVRGKVAV